MIVVPHIPSQRTNMIRSKLMEEMVRVDGLLEEIAMKMNEKELTASETRRLSSEKKKLEAYKKELLREWRHLSL